MKFIHKETPHSECSSPRRARTQSQSKSQSKSKSKSKSSERDTERSQRNALLLAQTVNELAHPSITPSLTHTHFSPPASPTTPLPNMAPFPVSYLLDLASRSPNDTPILKSISQSNLVHESLPATFATGIVKKVHVPKYFPSKSFPF
ncbi:hypothetical protein AA313_de0203693 [Arthrobotrys entomopaga]|nr:hypothetical protein AA313_de0203693 [Arthrobotrys entomopaga]